MAEYIDREAAISLIKQYGHDAIDGGRYSLDTVDDCIELANRIKALHAADVAPVVYGRWGTGRFNLETGNYEEQCTRCRNFSKEYGKPYCPNCGAKIDGGDSDAKSV